MDYVLLDEDLRMEGIQLEFFLTIEFLLNLQILIKLLDLLHDLGLREKTLSLLAPPHISVT